MDRNCSQIQGYISLTIPVHMEVESPPMRVMIPVLTVFGIFGNIVAFVKIVSDKRLHTHTYFAVAALIMSDLISVGLYGMHVLVYLSFEVKEELFEKFFMSATFGSTHASAAHVVFLVGLRYYCVVKPIHYETLSKRILLKISCILWVLSVCFAIVYYILRFHSDLDVLPTVLLFRGYLLFLPICFIIYFHLKKIMVIRSVSFSRKLRTSGGSERVLRARSQIIVMSRMVSVILTVFTMSAALYPISFCLIYFGVCCSEYECRDLLLMARMAWILKFSINPIIYLLFSEVVYSRVKKYLTKGFTTLCEIC